MSTWHQRFAARARAAQGRRWHDCTVAELGWWLADAGLYWLFQASRGERQSQLNWHFGRHLSGSR